MLSGINVYLRRLAVIISLGLAAICFYQHLKIKKQDDEIGRITNNYEVYQNLNNKLSTDNRTLQLEIGELNHTKDSLLQQVKNIQKKLNIKDKNLQQVQVINTVIKDTVTKVIDRQIDFNEELKLNPLTTITVMRKDSILTATLDLKNDQVLFIEERKQYRHAYKNWFQRFLHFDWKRDRIRNYHIDNSNPLIEVTQTRLVEVIQ